MVYEPRVIDYVSPGAGTVLLVARQYKKHCFSSYEKVKSNEKI